MVDEVVKASLTELKSLENDWSVAGLFMYNAVNSLKYGKVDLVKSEMGLFTKFYDDYKDVAPWASDRATEGMNACKYVMQALSAGRELYANQEHVNKDTFDDLSGQ
ncbi:hypothetical protein [Nocardia heshunensis]